MASKKKLTDITIRMRRKDGRKVSGAVARKALWAAFKIAKRGGNLATELREWTIEAINWRNVYQSGGEKTYTYSTSDAVAEALQAMGGIFNSINWETDLRVAVPDA
jgi:hypothetical protein